MDLPVPVHIRNAPTRLAKDLGHGKDYRYPHDFPHAFVEQDYLPDALSSISFLRVGATGEFQDTDGGEYTYDSWEVAAGGGVALPFEVTVTTLYRFTQRMYNNNSVFGTGTEHRDDDIHRLTLEAVRPIGENFELSVAMMMSHPSTISKPPPSAYPFTRAMTGTSSVVRSAMPPKPPGRDFAQ